MLDNATKMVLAAESIDKSVAGLHGYEEERKRIDDVRQKEEQRMNDKIARLDTLVTSLGSLMPKLISKYNAIQGEAGSSLGTSTPDSDDTFVMFGGHKVYHQGGLYYVDSGVDANIARFVEWIEANYKVAWEEIRAAPESRVSSIYLKWVQAGKPFSTPGDWKSFVLTLLGNLRVKSGT
nr:MAG: hypothetical protein [Guiyang nephotettix cincticeps rhabdovirus 1]